MMQTSYHLPVLLQHCAKTVPTTTEQHLWSVKAIAVLPQGGVWVLGMIKGGAADGAGIRQGDEILRVNGQEISSLSPFKVAGLLQGTDSENDFDSFVELEVRGLPLSPGTQSEQLPICRSHQLLHVHG